MLAMTLWLYFPSVILILVSLLIVSVCLPSTVDGPVVVDRLRVVVLDRRVHVVLAVDRDHLLALGVVQRDLVVARRRPWCGST